MSTSFMAVIRKESSAWQRPASRSTEQLKEAADAAVRPLYLGSARLDSFVALHADCP
jgi:hypothetical protein